MILPYRYTLNIRAFLIILFFSLASNTASAQINSIKADKQVCTVKDGSNTCSVYVEWTGNDSEAPFCVFIKSSKQLWSCSPKSGRAEYTYVPLSTTTLELRSGSYEYDSSKFLADVVLAGLDKQANTNPKSIEAVKKDYLKRFKTSFLGSSWDGKLFFEARYFGHTHFLNFAVEVPRYGLAVRVLRHNNLKKDSSGKINFSYTQSDGQGYTDQNGHAYVSDNEYFDPTLDKRIFSDSYLFDSPSFTSEQISELANKPGVFTKDIKNYSQMIGNNLLETGSPNNLVVFPHPSVKNNPYRSDLNGNPSDTENYVAYRLYGVTASYKIGSVQSQYNINGKADNPYYFLGKFELIVVVKDPDTNYATVSNVRVLSPARPLYDTTGSLIYGYEMGVSLDGQLIVYSGNPKAPQQIGGRGGQVMYTYTQNAFSNNAWSVPKNLAAMYEADGPGRPNQETYVNNVPFSKRFPIAKYPIKDFLGNVFNADTPIMGAYVWIGFDASEAVFSTVSSYYGPARQGTVMVGARTNGVIYHSDGDMNLSRGNPTDSYGLGEGDRQRLFLDKYYQELCAPNFNNEKLGKRGFEQVLMAPIGLFGTSWDPYIKDSNKTLPLLQNTNTYGFLVSSSDRYAEVALPDNKEDLILYYPMNEPVYFNPTVLNDFLAGKISNQEVRVNGTKFITNQTADYSKFLHVGNMVGGANYPFEYHDVKTLWRNGYNAITAERPDAAAINCNQNFLKDIQEGAYGNSIYLKRNGSIQTTITNQAYKQIASHSEFNVSFWLKKNANSTGPVLNLQGILNLWVNGSNLDLTFYNKQYLSGQRVVTTNVFPIGQWAHISINYKLGRFKIYVNGRLVKNEGVKGEMLDPNNFLSGVKLILGPNGNLTGEDFFQMDEAYIYSTSLNEEEIAKLVGHKLVSTAKSPIEVPTYLSKSAQEFSSVDASKDALIKQLGFDLFNSKELSSNRTVSCATCHKPQFSFADNTRLSIGVNGTTLRNTPALINVLFTEQFFLDGRADTLEEQMLHPIIDNKEMGFANLNGLLDRLSGNSQFNLKFNSAFGTGPNQSNLAIALARYVRGLIAQESLFDQDQLSSSARKGMEIFFGYGNCVACHSGPNFTDGKLHNVGLPLESSDPLMNGRANISKRYSDVGAFKTPSLRNIAQTAPYFHDGRFNTLAEVIDHYSNGGDSSQNQSIHVRPLLLNATQKQNLEDFLRSLSSHISAK